jgi:flagellar biosynthesis regulator FlbT
MTSPEELAAIVARDATAMVNGVILQSAVDRRALLALLRDARMLMGEWTEQSVVQPGGVRDLLATLEGLEP